MTAVDDRLGDAPHASATPPGLLGWLTTTDHKRIGILYMVTAFGFFLVGGVLALLMRTELADPEIRFLDRDVYSQFFTMHGSIMMFLFAMSFAIGLANYLVPLQIGAPDMAFPRMNALSYWLYLGGGLVMVSGFLTARGAAAFGWFAYTPLSDVEYSPGPGADLWIAGVALGGISASLGAVNIVSTILTLRAPGMVMTRMPIFTWNMLVTSGLILIAFPVLTAALAALWADRHLGAHFFDVTSGGEPILWQHLFWFFGHPEVYIIALPYFGVVTEVIPVFSRRPLFGYRPLIFATLTIGGLSATVWAHHMFATGEVLLPFFSFLSFLIAVPTGIKFFNWIGSMWRGSIRFDTPMLFAVGFLVSFLLGGVTGVMLASPPIDFHVHDTYFVVAHMHYVLVPTAVLALFAGVYFWFPKFTGRLLDERLGKTHFWLLFVGTHVTFFVQHLLGLQGMPRRVAEYEPAENWTGLNLVSSIGSWLLGFGVLVFCWNVVVSLRRGRPAGDDPWEGYALEWATSSPPPAHNFESGLPPIRSERPVFDARQRARAEGG